MFNRTLLIVTTFLFYNIWGNCLGQKITVLQKATCNNKSIKLSLLLPPVVKKTIVYNT